MTLKSRINDDLKAAMRSGDARRRDALRLLLAAVKQREVDERKELGEADVVGVIERMIKQRRESIVQFEKGRRQDLVDKEAAELSILQSYMPKPLTSEELQVLVLEAIREVQATSPKEMGKVMAILMPRVTGRADGKVVNTLVREALSKS